MGSETGQWLEIINPQGARPKVLTLATAERRWAAPETDWPTKAWYSGRMSDFWRDWRSDEMARDETGQRRARETQQAREARGGGGAATPRRVPWSRHAKRGLHEHPKRRTLDQFCQCATWWGRLRDTDAAVARFVPSGASVPAAPVVSALCCPIACNRVRTLEESAILLTTVTMIATKVKRINGATRLLFAAAPRQRARRTAVGRREALPSRCLPRQDLAPRAPTPVHLAKTPPSPTMSRCTCALPHCALK